jgi:hypothetical protein
MRRRNHKLLITIIMWLVYSLAAALYIRWQFNLCYPEVSESFWFCLQHLN